MNPWLTIKSEEAGASRSGGNASLDVSTPLQGHFMLFLGDILLLAIFPTEVITSICYHIKYTPSSYIYIISIIILYYCN